jgi:hypothetical protein
LLLGSALAIPAYGIATSEQLSGAGWAALALLAVAGIALILRVRNWNAARLCPRCGESVPRTLSVCPRCGLDFGAVWRAAISKQKLP